MAPVGRAGVLQLLRGTGKFLVPAPQNIDRFSCGSADAYALLGYMPNSIARTRLRPSSMLPVVHILLLFVYRLLLTMAG
jgi:hypothetical protein